MVKKNKLKSLLFVALGCLLLFFALERISNHVGGPRSSEKPMIKGTILSKPLSLPKVALQRYGHDAFTNDDFKDHWTLLFFGFTNCPKVCPTTMAQLNAMIESLQQKVTAEHMPQVIMVSVDPARDTAKRMHSYVTSFNPNFIGLRTDEAAISNLALAMNVSYAKVDMKGMNHDHMHMDHYTMTHTATISVIGPAGQVRAYLSYPHHGQEMANDYLSILGFYHQI